MPVITLCTEVHAHPNLVFDLTRSIEAHLYSTKQSGEKAVAGVTSGLMNLGDSVTWEAKHLGVVQQLTSKITEFERPILLTDIQLKGAFKSFEHRHLFSQKDGIVTVIDQFDYTAPLGFLGKIADVLFLKNYMRKFLEIRNRHLKMLAESEAWKPLLPESLHGEYH